MSIFDTDNNKVEIAAEFEEALLRCVAPGTVKCVVYAPKINIILKKSNEIYGIPLHEPSFATYIQGVLDQACLGLKEHKHRRVLSLDCKLLKKGDALGRMKGLSQDDDDLIVVFENVTQIPDGDLNIYDDKRYVENLLIRSWKNEDIYFDDSHINRHNLTIILTCPPEDEEKLMAECSACSYAWVGDIEKVIAERMGNKYE